MEVILLERIEKLGQMGDVVSVKPGYARNFLLPQAKALRATTENSKQFEAQRVQLEAINLEMRTEAEKVGKKLDGLNIIVVRQAGESGQLYGSVNARDIADQVIDGGFTITRQQVELAQPIKALGLYDVQVTLHPEVSVTITANVARSSEEAKIQAKIGHAVMSIEEEEEAQAKIKAEEVFEKVEDAEVAEAKTEEFMAGAEDYDAKSVETPTGTDKETVINEEEQS
jgi:large subunit ribosomal protein L9